MSDTQPEVRTEVTDDGDVAVKPPSSFDPETAIEATSNDEHEREQTTAAVEEFAQPLAMAKDEESIAKQPSPLLLSTPDLLASHPADSLHPPDSPTTSLISTLRSQLLVLSDQTHALNSKLINSISRSADLEDELTELKERHSSLGVKARDLEKEKDRWEESMQTGLLVERSQIRDEMQRLAAGLVEEERRRGSAEERREQVENEVDDLTAKLFDQANTMVAVERMSRAEAEGRLKSTEENLANAEAAVRAMQLQLQTLSLASHPVNGGGSGASSAPPSHARKYLSSHVPYAEFLTFLQHLRALRPLKKASKDIFPPPQISNILAQAFLARTIMEDHDPTLRLDAAPDLSWLSRRSVSQAIIAGDLIIEPVSATTLLASTSASMMDIGCSLCGKAIFANTVPQSPAGGHFGPPPMHPHRTSGSGVATTSTTTSRFSLKPFFNSSSVTGSPSHNIPPSPTQSPLSSPALGAGGSLTSVYIFRIARSATTVSSQGEKDAKLYPLCRSGWCLERLRATCELWHFIRTGVVHVVWHGDDMSSDQNNRSSVGSTVGSQPQQPVVTNEPAPSTSLITVPNGETRPPPLPTRKKSSWALGFKWKSADAPPSPGEKRGSVGSLGAEKESEGETSGLGLGEPLNLDEKVRASSEAEIRVVQPVEINEKRDADEVKEGQQEEVPTILEPEPEVDSSIEDRLNALIANGAEGASPEKDTANLDSRIQADGSDGVYLQRGDSSTSIPLSTSSQTDDHAFFSTPKEGDHDLPEEGLETPHVGLGETGNPVDEAKVEKKAEQELSLNSPIVEQSSTPNSPKPSSTATPPPPVPKRAPARNRLSQLGGGGSTTSLTGLVAEGSNSPTSAATERSVDDGEAATPTTEKDKIGSSSILGLSDGDKSQHQIPEGGEEGQEVELTPVNLDEKYHSPSLPPPPPRHPAALPHPPPLPPRHPKTPTMQVNGGVGGGEEAKRFLSVEPEGWEEKTWRGVVRLKEGMWKARIGVVDE
ncbi:hypothetical protein IAR55_005272 [Kwoniella newhampshirensis]|uniref:GDP/GTP exchange factor Sec2 N-terminal domain-containing protein n=1 Tax=Kwoniella newhampshirensis TaxID=1651941 RepID=A0AAW0YHH6_9TREE